MKIILNVDALLSPPLTGVGHYVRHLLDGLMEAGSGVDVACVAAGQIVPPPARVAADQASGPPPGLSPVKRVLIRVPGVTRLRNAVRAAQLRQRFASLSCDLYHEPNHIVQPPRRARVVVTIHDLSVLHYPQLHPADRVRLMGGQIAASARRADRIVTPSEYIRRDVIGTLGIDPAKVRAVHHGVGPEFCLLAPGAVAPVLDAYGLRRGGYVLALGTREPRKNLDRLIEAFMGLPAAVRAGRPLVLVGAPGWRAEALEQRIEQLQREGSVRRLGYVPDGHRPGLYAGAAAFAYPSLYEGFGLPPLESAACGTPVLTSVDSPMAEVLGDAAQLVDPLDVGAIAGGLERLLTRPESSDAALAAASGFSARYTWAASVAGHVAVYRELSSATAGR